MPKESRHIRDRRNRKVVKSKGHYKYKVVRKEPPKAEKKVVARQEIIKDEKTGKAKITTVYDIKDVQDDKMKKKLKNKLYIPYHPPPKEIRYKRDEKPQFKDVKIKYKDPSSYGSLSAYKKSQLIKIAKDQYGMGDKLAQNIDKDDIIKYINKKFAGKEIRDENFLPTKLKLQRVEPVRKQPISYIRDPANPLKFEFYYGKKKIGVTDDPHTPKFDQLNAKFQKDLTMKHVKPLGTSRKFSKKIHERFINGMAHPDELVSELMTHLDLPHDEKLKLTHLPINEINKLYKKSYKQSLLPEDVRYQKPILFKKLHYAQSPSFAQPPLIKDPIGKLHVAGSVPFPGPLLPYNDFDYDVEYGKGAGVTIPKGAPHSMPPAPPDPKLLNKPLSNKMKQIKLKATQKGQPLLLNTNNDRLLQIQALKTKKTTYKQQMQQFNTEYQQDQAKMQKIDTEMQKLITGIAELEGKLQTATKARKIKEYESRKLKKDGQLSVLKYDKKNLENKMLQLDQDKQSTYGLITDIKLKLNAFK